MEGLGQRVRNCRQRQGIKQETLAEMAELSTSYISAIEREAKQPSLDALVRIANALHVSADELLMDSLRITFDIRSTELGQKIEQLHPWERDTILDVVNVMVKHARKR